MSLLAQLAAKKASLKDTAESIAKDEAITKSMIGKPLDIDPVSMHGRKGVSHWPGPLCVSATSAPTRSDQLNLTRANEYVDTEEVLEL